jgi:NADP-dependent 3-hydroxy acid dehydrogenase YdfG
MSAILPRKQNAVVAGADSSTGKTIAVALAERGFSLCLIGRDRDRLAATVKQTDKAAPFVLPYAADLTVEGGIQELANTVERSFDGIDLLVHCTSIAIEGGIGSTPIPQFDTLYEINVRVPYVLTRTLLPALQSQQGQVIFLTSAPLAMEREETGLFQSTQRALREIANDLRLDASSNRVRIMNMCVGRGTIRRTGNPGETLEISAGVDHLLQPEAIAQVVVFSLTMPRGTQLTYVELQPS